MEESVGITLRRGWLTLEKHGERAGNNEAFKVYCEQKTTKKINTPEKDEVLR